MLMHKNKMKNNSEQYKKEVVEVLYKISKDKDLLGDFIKDILTPREFDNIGVRWQIVKRLAKGEPNIYRWRFTSWGGDSHPWFSRNA